MEFIYAKYILLQLDILMQRSKIIMHGINQSVVKTGRNIILCQRCFQCIFIVMHGSIKITGACRACECCCQRITVLMIGIHQAGKGIFTQYTVRRGHIQQIAAFADASLVALSVGNFRELHIGTHKCAEGRCCSTCCQMALRKNSLFICRQNMV